VLAANFALTLEVGDVAIRRKVTTAISGFLGYQCSIEALGTFTLTLLICIVAISPSDYESASQTLCRQIAHTLSRKGFKAGLSGDEGIGPSNWNARADCRSIRLDQKGAMECGPSTLPILHPLMVPFLRAPGDIASYTCPAHSTASMQRCVWLGHSFSFTCMVRLDKLNQSSIHCIFAIDIVPVGMCFYSHLFLAIQTECNWGQSSQVNCSSSIWTLFLQCLIATVREQNFKAGSRSAVKTRHRRPPTQLTCEHTRYIQSRHQVNEEKSRATCRAIAKRSGC